MKRDERKRELGAFLRSRRQALRPEQFNLPESTRRRTPGLKREEVAFLSSVSVSWYAWLEQGRDIQPLRAALLRVASTLRLSEDELKYVFLLLTDDTIRGWNIEGHQPDLAIASIQTTLDMFGPTPAAVYNRRFDIVASNHAAGAIYGRALASSTKWECNMLWRFFKDPERGQMYPDGTSDLGIRNLVEVLRVNWAAGMERDEVDELVDELRSVSDEFNRMWSQRRIGKLSSLPGRILLPRSEQSMEIQYTRLTIPDSPGYSLAAVIPQNDVGFQLLDQYLNRVA